MDARQQAELDQAITETSNNLSAFWWSLYEKCMREGFNAAQAMELVKAYIQKPESTA